MNAGLRRISRTYHAARILPRFVDRQRGAALARRVLSPIRRRVAMAARFVLIRQARLVDRMLGLEAGNRFFWASPTMVKDWADVERRLFFLRAHGGALDAFVDRALAHSDNFTVWTGLARSVLTRNRVANLLGTLDPATDARLADRIRASHVFAAAVVGAGALCLDDAGAKRLARAVENTLPWVTDGYVAAIDSLSARLDVPPADAYLRGLLASGFRRPKRHRLIISANVHDRSAMSLLFGGAEKVTLYAMGDLYGKTDFADAALHCAPDLPVSMENARSRITRFSSEYHTLHQKTRDLAETIHTRLADTGADVRWLPPDGRAFAEMSLADALFFPSLALAALKKLIADPEFDHIVIELGVRQQDRDFCAMLSWLDQLREDPRVEVVSNAASMAERLAIAPRLAELRDGFALPARAGYWGPPVTVQARALSSVVKDAVPALPAWSGTGKRRVLFLCAASSAYNSSTAAYLSALLRRYDTRLAFAGTNPLPVLNELPDLGAIAATDITRLRTGLQSGYARRLGGLAAWLDAFVLDVARDETRPDGTRTIPAHLLAVRAPRLVREALLGFLVNAWSADRWLAAMKAAGGLPDVLVVTPYRDMNVASFVAAARRYGLPTIALEPHGLNSNYCRYATIHSDFYGVVAEAFRHEAATGFGIPLDRCRVVGSPRLTAPATYDLAARTRAARDAAARDLGVRFAEGQPVLAFFSQPTNWDQLARIWRILLEGSAALDVRILLKTHPEEAFARTQRYLDVATEMGMSDRVEVWRGSAKEAIESADIVFAAYSATVVEAAALRRPVICLAPVGVDYPLDQHAVVGAPLVRDAGTLNRMLAAFVADPTPLRRAAEGFVTRERQITEDIGVSLARFIDEVAAMPRDQAIRRREDLPEGCFLPGPHRAFQI